ncbi:stress response protein SCP2 [Streptomyces sp. KhCrAH-43]|uniref:TerD family protein n=1 Tax=unclassified Streptomyces TaxID=2593676 RepID=UPI000376C1A8|nr:MULTISPECIES: TerD family protein [unclassified Streptomyces]MYS38101.1 stress protein [Streptomyces sp. SID4920]MYX66288.1 stress protein [Streptomyces sp. SID8373]RAJ67774.1 stress response protein SCP2 [Streptomyces sp. KhCrAH-43]
MAREFQRGHKAKISDLTPGTDLYVGVQIAGPGLSFDISCFGLDANEQLSDDRYFIFFNQPKSPEESIQLLGAQSGDTESFRVTLDRIPANIHKLSFTATVDGAGQMSQVGPGYIRIVAGGQEVVRYAFNGSEFSTERAVMLGDFYLKDVWRFAAVGQGFDGGLEALLKNFGGEVAEETPAAAPPQAAAPSFAPPAQAAPAPSFGAPAAPQAPQPAPSFGTPPPAPAPAPTPQQQMHAAPTIIAPMTPPGGTVPPPPPPAPYGQPAQPQQPQFGHQPHQQQFGQVPGQAAAPYGQQTPSPYGQQPPGGQGMPGGGVPQAAGAGLQAALQPYKETATGQRWTPQNQQLMRVDLNVSGTGVLARQGSMVMYQGKVDFSYKGAGFAGRLVGNATGQEMQLMRCTGRGQVFLAEEGSHLHAVELQGDGICVSAENVLAFDETLQYEVRRIEGHGIPGGALFTMQFQGTGTVVVKTHGTPVVLPVTPTTFADCNAVVAWSSASQVIVSSQVRLRRNAYPGHSGETVNLQFRGAPGNFIVVQPYEV